MFARTASSLERWWLHRGLHGFASRGEARHLEHEEGQKEEPAYRPGDRAEHNVQARGYPDDFLLDFRQI